MTMMRYYYVEVASWPRQKEAARKRLLKLSPGATYSVQLCEATTAFLLGVPSRSLNLGRTLQRKACLSSDVESRPPNDRVRRGPPADPRNLNHNREWRRQSPLLQKSSASSSTWSKEAAVREEEEDRTCLE